MFEVLKIGESAKKPQKFVPKHPNPEIGDKHGIALYLHGKHSEEYRNAIAAMLRRQREKEGEQSPDEAINESVELITACCAGYDIGGKPADFDREKLAETLRADDYRWLRIQAERFMQQDDHYFQKPSKS